jgi:hypothetical protein
VPEDGIEGPTGLAWLALKLPRLTYASRRSRKPDPREL